MSNDHGKMTRVEARAQVGDLSRTKGRIAKLARGGLVFLARHPDRRDGPSWLIALKNKDGDDVRLRLSDEALAALIGLRLNSRRGRPFRAFPWKVEAQRFVWTQKLAEAKESTS